MSKQWCIPPKANAEFVWKMEDVLEVYKRPYDPKRPVVCLDETSKQLIGQTRTPVPAAPGQVAHYDSEYVRKGVANLFMLFEPLRKQTAAWERNRDAAEVKVNWQFTTADARTKLKRLYPSLEK